MILECPNCDTQYELPVQLPPEGRKVRCASCQHIWIATPKLADDPALDAPAASAEAEEPAAPAPNLAALDEFTKDEIVFREEDETETEPEQPDQDQEEAAADDENYSQSEMEEAFSAAVAEAGMSATEEEPPPESPPIVIGKAKRKGGMALPVNLAAGWAALALFVAGVVAVGYFQRVNIVRALPGTASAYERIGLPVNVRGLAFDGVKYSWETSAGRTVLEVFGDIVNVTDQPLHIPTVVFGLRTKEMVEVYQWAADVRNDKLPAGERTAFSAQIPSPPKSIRDVQVRFAKVR